MTEDTKITPDEHSDVVGGSTAGRVLACPGSVQLNQAVKKAHITRIAKALALDYDVINPDLISAENLETAPATFVEMVNVKYREETTSEYAAEGTGLHEAMAWILDNDEEPESVVDRTFEGILITPTLYSECIIPALDGFDNYCDKVYEEDGEDLVFTVEERCQLPGIPGAFGTSDIIGKTSKRMIIWDWKFGAGVPVSPYQNDQLRFYGRAAIHTKREWFGLTEGENPADDHQVDLIISQPRIGDGEPQVWTTTYDDLEAFRWRLISAVSEATGKDPSVKRGGHCKWCEAKHICPAKQQLGQKIMAKLDDTAADLAATDLGEEAFDMKAAALLKAKEVQFTPDDLADWLEDANDIEAWVKWVRSLAMEELKAGREVTGFELDQGLGNASWLIDGETPEDKVIDRRLASYGLSVDERRVSKPISPAVARKLIKGKGVDKHKVLVEKMIDRPKSGVKMVPAGTAKSPVKPISEKVAALGEKLKGKLDG